MASWDENRQKEESLELEDDHLEEENYYSMLNLSKEVEFYRFVFLLKMCFKFKIKKKTETKRQPIKK